MANAFAITVDTNAVQLDEERKPAKVSFTVTNSSGRELTGRMRVLAEEPAHASWFQIEGAEGQFVDRDFADGETRQFTVAISVPANAQAGAYRFNLHAESVSDPDEYWGQSAKIRLDIPEPKPEEEKKKIPWWVFAAAAAVAVIVISVVIFVVTRPDKVEMPNVVGTRGSDAVLALMDVGFSRSKIALMEVRQAGGDSTIKSQVPEEGDSVRVNTEVILEIFWPMGRIFQPLDTLVFGTAIEAVSLDNPRRKDLLRRLERARGQ